MSQMHPGEYNKKFIGNIIIVTLHCLLALMALLGIIPFFRKFMEADFSLAHRKKGFAVCSGFHYRMNETGY
jgi:hypothetical protein